MTKQETIRLISAQSDFTIFTGTEWDCTNKFFTPSGNMAFTIAPITKNGIFVIKSNSSYACSFNGISVPINATGKTILCFLQVDGENIITDKDGNPILITDVVPDTDEFLAWSQLTNMADAGSGTLDNTNSSSGGGTATKRLVKTTGNYVQQVIPNNTVENELFVFFISELNDGVNTWSGTDVIVGMYLLGTMNTRVGTSAGGTTADTGITPAAGEIWRLEVDGENILVKRSTNSGVSFSTVATKTGVLTGITNIYIRGILVTGDAGQRVIQNAKGKGLVTI